jgi:transposase-like protein
MAAKRRRIEAALKAKAGLAAVRGDRTTSELAGQFGVHPTQIGQWKRQLVDGAVELFSGDQRRRVENQDALIAELYEQIGRLQMETAWLKKKSVFRDLSGQESYTQVHGRSMRRSEKGLSRASHAGPNRTEIFGILRFPDTPLLSGTLRAHKPSPHHLFALLYLRKRNRSQAGD